MLKQNKTYQQPFHKGKHLHGGEFGYMIADFDFTTHAMKTWSDVGSTMAVVREVARLKGVDVASLDAKEIFDHYHEDPIYEKVVEFQNKFDKVNNHKFNKEV